MKPHLRLLILALFVFSSVVMTSVDAAQPSKRPNILFAFADDWGRLASIYAEANGPGTANDVVRTPNIDRVAKQGVLFRNAHVTAPSCTPCRSSLLSGQYFWRTGRGAVLQGAIWDSNIPAFPLLLKDNGYHIGKMYKVWSPGTPADAPIGGQQFAYQKAGGRINQFSQNATKLVADGKPVEDAKGELLDEVRRNFADFLAAQPAGQPFYFWYGPTNVHRKWTRGSGKALWGIDSESLKGKLPPSYPDVPEIREDFADYLGEIQAFDAAVGVLLKQLEDKNLLDNTVVVISGDHGPPGFPHGKCNLYTEGTGVLLAASGPSIPGGRVVDDFVNLTDLAPTFLELGGVAAPDVMTGRSLVPVLTSSKQGLVDPQRTWVVTGRERHVAAARADYRPYPQRAIKTKDFLYIHNFEPERYPLGDPYNLTATDSPTEEELTENTYATHLDVDAGPAKAWLVLARNNPQWKPYYDREFGKRPREELYVLADDPGEVRNVSGDPRYAAVQQDLHQRLMNELTRTNDPRVTGDRQFFEQPPLAGPVPDAGANKKPLQRKGAKN
jgi:N-sulfoglucosamine sulfohydrolase